MFETQMNRRETNNVKWNPLKETGDDQLLPMTIADMDIATPDFVRNAMQAILDEKVMGYSAPPAEFYQTFLAWEKDQHKVHLTQEQLILAPSVVTGMSFAIRYLTKPNDQIVVMSPYYRPYYGMVTENNRRFVDFPLEIRDGLFAIDFEALEKVLADEATTAMLVCNPHNPGGRVWTLPELQQLQTLANQYNVVILDDEIHDDTIFPDAYAVSMLSELMATDENSRTVMFKSATKAFNLAGTKVSFIATRNQELLEILKQAAAAEALEEINAFGIAGTQAAYAQGHRWLEVVNQYLAQNRDQLVTTLSETTRIKPMNPESTYLLWLDFRDYGLSEEQLMDELQNQDHLLLNAGSIYGPAGVGFLRLNFAVDRQVIEEAIAKLQAFDQRHREA